MGLDISAYSGLKVVEKPELDQEGEPLHDDQILISGELIAITEDEFHGRTEGCVAGVYTCEDRYGFHAGSYSGYNVWREQLSQFALKKSPEAVWGGPGLKGPFVELIWFSDCEGVIGPVVAAKLAKDFSDFQDRANEYANQDVSDGDYWLEHYNDWRKAFELAAQNGAVEFH